MNYKPYQWMGEEHDTHIIDWNKIEDVFAEKVRLFLRLETVKAVKVHTLDPEFLKNLETTFGIKKEHETEATNKTEV